MKREEGEDVEQYKTRRRMEKLLLKKYLNGKQCNEQFTLEYLVGKVNQEINTFNEALKTAQQDGEEHTEEDESNKNI